MGEIKTETLDGSYVHDCLIKRRSDDTSDVLFFVPSDGSRMVTKLRGYAIVPREEYESLLKLSV